MAKVEGLERLKRRLARLPAKMKAQVKPAIHQGADELVAMQKRLAPVGKGDPKNGIRLRDSIHKEDGPHELAVVVIADDPVGKFNNARLQEFGTTDTPAQPYFYPPYRALRRRIRGRITRAVGKAVRSNV